MRPYLRLTITMKNLLLVSGLLSGLFSTPLAWAHDAAAGEQHRHVSVSGRGEVSVAPDRARLRLGVTQINADLNAAQTQVNKVVREYLAKAKSLGVKDEHISTAGMGIQPEYVWDEKLRNNKLVGYRVSRDIEIVVVKLDQLGDLVLGATAAGVNQVQAPQLESSKAKDIEHEALVKASQDAEAKAKLLAETLGAKLGPVHQISAADFSPPPPMPKVMAMRAEAAFDGGNQEMGFAAGEIRYSASVNAEFELLSP
jgi:uncharacterized protein YggE